MQSADFLNFALIVALKTSHLEYCIHCHKLIRATTKPQIYALLNQPLFKIDAFSLLFFSQIFWKQDHNSFFEDREPRAVQKLFKTNWFIITDFNDFTRGKKMLEQLSRPRFFRVLKFPALIPTCLARRKAREISKPGKNRGLESYSKIFSPLGFVWSLKRQQYLSAIE